MIRAIIIDDEQHCTDRLSFLINEYNNALVEIVATCKSVDESLWEIRKEKPDLIFLDVELGGQNGFDILRQLPEINFEIIFVTGHEQYAVQAFRFSAFDYLMKPVDQFQLSNALQKLAIHFTEQERKLKLETLLYNLSGSDAGNKRLCIPTSEGFTLAETKDIIRCEAMTNYTVIYFSDNHKVTVSRTLKDFEHLLKDCNFFRVHN